MSNSRSRIPHSAEAEQSVLGAVLLGGADAARQVVDSLEPEDFYTPAHAAVFEAMQRLHDADQPIDGTTLTEELRRAGDFEKHGGASLITRLLDAVPTTHNAEHYVGIVQAHSRRRRIRDAGERLARLASRPDVDDAQLDDALAGIVGAVNPTARVPALEILTLGELAERVAAAGPRRYLIRGIWPAGAYGVHAAEMKAQKTWNVYDLAVSVASDTPWLNHFPIDTPGPVLIFAGEGGDSSILRRVRAICESRGLKAEDLPIRVCARAPHLRNHEHMRRFEQEIERTRPALVIIDPLYLAAGGADGKDLYAMGELLERPQLVCDRHGTALVVVTHYNRTKRTGAGRITGAGPAEWGRVLIGADIKSRLTDPDTGATTVVATMDAIGGEIPDQQWRVKRTIQATDPTDPDSPLTYTVEVDNGHPDLEDGDMPPARAKLLDATRTIGTGATWNELVDWIAAKYGHGLRRETVSREMKTLSEAGLVDAIERPGKHTLWFPAEPDDNEPDEPDDPGEKPTPF